MKIENLRFSNSQMKFARIRNFHMFLRRLTPEFVTTRYPDAAYGTPYELYDEEVATDILDKSKKVIKWIESQIKLLKNG